MKFSVEDFFSKCDQIRSFLRIWSHLLKKCSMENFIFCTVFYSYNSKKHLLTGFLDSNCSKNLLKISSEIAMA